MSTSSSFVTVDLLESIAASLEVPKLTNEAARALAPDVEYKLRELIQDAQKFSRHARRVKLTTEDVNNALRMRNTEPLYGFLNKDPARYIKAIDHVDVYCIADPDIPLPQLIEQPLPRAPLEVGVMPHWLFINGVQPNIPENQPMERPPAKRPRQPAAAITAGPANNAAQQGPAAPQEGHKAVNVQLPVQHVVSLELQSYFNKAMTVIHDAVAAAKQPPTATQPGAAAQPPGDAAAAGASAAQPPQHWGDMAVVPVGAAGNGAGAQQQGRPDPKLDAVLAALSIDTGLHPLVPYFVNYLANEFVAATLATTPAVVLLLRLTRALLRNSNMHLQDYIHQVLPGLLSCVVAKGIGAVSATWPEAPSHWEVRQLAAEVVGQVCANVDTAGLAVQPRVVKTLLKAFLDTTKPLTTHYGAIVGLAALGPMFVRRLLLPQLPAYLDRLQPLMADEDEVPGDNNNNNSLMLLDGPTANGGDPVARATERALRAAQRADAVRVHGTLVEVVGQALYQLLVDSVAASQADQAAEEAARTSAAALAKLAEAFKPTDARNAANGNSAGQGDAAPGGSATDDRARACAIFSLSWREDVSLRDLAWAAGELLGPAVVARLPQGRPAYETL